MLRNIIIVFFFFCGTIVSMSQTQAQKKVEVKNTTKKKLSFGEIEVENKSSAQYKTLEVRYTLNPLTSTDEIVIEGVSYKMFPDRKSAITYYNSIKSMAQTKEVYYVTALASKTTEVFTFRVN